MLGNGRLEALCFDGEKRLAHIRGKLRKKVWINQGDIILLSLRDYQDEKGDVILKYSADEARSLKAYGELPESAKINETDTYVFSYAIWPGLESRGTRADVLGVDMDTKAWMITLSSTRIGMTAVMTRRLMSMRSKRVFDGRAAPPIEKRAWRNQQFASVNMKCSIEHWARCCWSARWGLTVYTSAHGGV